MIGSTSPDTNLVAPSPRPSSETLGVQAEAMRRLRQSGYSALWDLSCEVQGGILRLRGRLSSYYLKQVAQTITAGVEGVRRVVNLIEVAASPVRTSPRHGPTSQNEESAEPVTTTSRGRSCPPACTRKRV